MTDHEAERRRAEQARALDAHRPSGALIENQYLHRKQEYVAVNKNDLDDILEFDTLANWLTRIGAASFAFGGGLVTDKLPDLVAIKQSHLFPLGIAFAVFGVVLFGIGLIMQRKKSTRIERIFNETRPVS